MKIFAVIVLFGAAIVAAHPLDDSAPKPVIKPTSAGTQIEQQKRIVESQTKFVDQLKGILQLQVDRLDSETTRLAEIKDIADKEKALRDRQKAFLEQQRKLMEEQQALLAQNINWY